MQNGGKVVGGHGAAGLVDDLSLSSYKNNFFVVINLTELKKKLNWLGFFPDPEIYLFLRNVPIDIEVNIDCFTPALFTSVVL